MSKPSRPTRTPRGVAVGYLPPPTAFGAPAKFKTFREQQEEALVLTDESDKRFTFLTMPTGSGKALTYIMYAMMTGKRTLVLTENKALQTQNMEDFKSIGLRNISGAGNYTCRALQPGEEYYHLRNQGRNAGMCDQGPCKMGLYCRYKDDGCELYDGVREVRESKLVVSNYANWLAVGKTQTGTLYADEDQRWGKFDLLILDEAHAAGEQTSKAITVELQVEELETFFGSHLPTLPLTVNRATSKLLGRSLPGRDEHDFRNWVGWLSSVRQLQVSALEGAAGDLRNAKDSGALHRELLADIKYLKRLGNDLHMLEHVKEADYDQWVVDRVVYSRGRSAVTFQPIWPGPYCEKYLFRGIKRVVGVSATLHPYKIEKLGIQKKDYDFYEFNSSFPLKNRPVYAFPVAFMKWDMADSDKKRVVHATDQIAKVFKDEKGLVHPVSYDRARYYQLHSSLGSRLVENTPDSTGRVVERFKSSKKPLVLVSPAISTGFDFPGDAARWQVLQKVPFADNRSQIQQRRVKADPKYPHAQAMDYIVQMAGRIVRGDDDYGSTFILDAVFWDWYERNGKQYAPRWFRESVTRISNLRESRERE